MLPTLLRTTPAAGRSCGIGNWLYDRTANVTFCGSSCLWLRARSGDRRRAACPPLRWGRLGARCLP